MKTDSMMKRTIAAALLCAGTLVAAAPALAAYPDKPIRLVVPFPAGTGADISARRIAQAMSEDLNQSIVVENRSGAGGSVGSEYVAKAAADGYTLLAGTLNTHAMNPAIYKDLAYDPISDFEPITRITAFPNVLVVPTSLQVGTLKELVDLAKTREGEPLTYGSGGVGTTAHLSAEVLAQTADIKLLHIPYQGTSRAMADVLAGRVNMIFGNVPVVMPHVIEGRLKALAITSPERSAQMPDVPTVEELDMKNAEISVWIALFAPAGTPPAILDTLSQSALRVLQKPEVQEGYSHDGGKVESDATPADFARTLKADIERWGQVVKASGASAN